MTPENNNKHAEQRIVPITFRAPTTLAKLIGQAAGKELLSTSAYCRRALARSVGPEKAS